MSDTLIAYFSRADENYFGGAIRYVKKGNTEIVCEKIILPLCTNEGSGMGSSETDIKKCVPNAILKKGLSIIGSQAEKSKSSVEKWLKATE